MPKAKLRSVGGSLMVAIPKPILALARLDEGAEVGIGVEDGKVVLTPAQPGRIGLAARLAKCNRGKQASKAERLWLDLPSVGREKIP